MKSIVVTVLAVVAALVLWVSILDDTDSQKITSRNGLGSNAEKAATHQMAMSLHPVKYFKLREIVGFYNLYEGKQTETFHRVIAEQVGTLDSSGLMHKIKTIYYVYFGQNYFNFTVPSNSTKYVRSNASARIGGEMNTLELLFKHCNNNPYDTVFYMHSKGTYSTHRFNTYLRWNLMKALMYCLNSTEWEDSDVCGLRFSPIPYPQMSGEHSASLKRQTLSLHRILSNELVSPVVSQQTFRHSFSSTGILNRIIHVSPSGNMWAARCAYIRTLLSPRDFGDQLLSVPAPPTPPTPPPTLPPCSPWFLGTRAAVPEHWVVSHPSAAVTDVLPLLTAAGRPVLFAWGYENLPVQDSWRAQPARFPRAGLTAGFFLQASLSYAPHLGCSRLSFRAGQCAAVYGRRAMDGLPCAGAFAAWARFAVGTFNASVPQAREFVEDARRLSESVDWARCVGGSQSRV
jgi:hypothetical protein